MAMRELFLIAALVFAAYLALLALDVEAQAAPDPHQVSGLTMPENSSSSLSS